MFLIFAETPSPPQKLGAIAVTKDSVTIGWMRPEHDGGSRVTQYFIEALEKGQSKWAKVTLVNTTSFQIKNLKENAEYFFRVSAQNHAGLGEPKEMIVPVVVKDQLGRFSTHLF